MNDLKKERYLCPITGAHFNLDTICVELERIRFKREAEATEAQSKATFEAYKKNRLSDAAASGAV
jgi:hypothetical protein